MENLPPEFYLHADVVNTARQLLGKILVTRIDGGVCSGRIVETEAYNGVSDRASHAFGGRLTDRTRTMFAAGGVAYVYLCYGLHHMFNVVCGPAQQPLAVLIRAVEPIQGIETMLLRRQKKSYHASLTRGPGSVAKAMGINTGLHNGLGLQQPPIWIGQDVWQYAADAVVAAPRIGVDYAGADALLPYRFFIGGNPHVSQLVSGKPKT